jgi:hypothetical protein
VERALHSLGKEQGCAVDGHMGHGTWDSFAQKRLALELELDRGAGPHRLPKTANLLDQEQRVSLKAFDVEVAVVPPQHTLHSQAATGERPQTVQSPDDTHAQLPLLYCLVSLLLLSLLLRLALRLVICWDLLLLSFLARDRCCCSHPISRLGSPSRATLQFISATLFANSTTHWRGPPRSSTPGHPASIHSSRES